MEKSITGGIQALHFVKALIISALITVIMLLLCAYLMLKTGIGDQVLGVLLAGVDALAVFVGGLYIGRKAGRQKFLWGLIFGVLYFLIYLVIAFLVNGPELHMESMLKSLLVMAAGGMIGGMIS